MPKSPEERAHLEWLGYVQPVGLVVSLPALSEAECYINQNIIPAHRRFLSCLSTSDATPQLQDLTTLCLDSLEWDPQDLVDLSMSETVRGDPHRLKVVLPQYNETLQPTHAVPAVNPQSDEPPWIMLVQQLDIATALDEPEADSRRWNAAPQQKFERLLRETEVPVGLLTNKRQLRLVYAPRGESSGYITFDVAEMKQVAGRPVFAAMHMLLNSERLFTVKQKQRLPALLKNSRKYQNTVSTKLAGQVLAALYELIRGFQAANDTSNQQLLEEVLNQNPNHVYSGLLTVLMRLVFVLYAEDRELLSSDSVYSNYYSVSGLYEQLRQDHGRFPDTMNQRYGAWARLVTLFRLIYEGGQHAGFHIPGRKGYLFDPDRYPFLEGRALGSRFQQDQEEDTLNVARLPRVSDGVVFHALRNLLILDGERLSYRTLDVEQIGSVYETIMGFNLEVATGKSIAIKPARSHGAPATINLEALLDTPGKDRAKWLREHSDQKLPAADSKRLKTAGTLDELLVALDRRIARHVTPRIVPAGSMVLQPSDERRRSGSHYTPRSLTEPIVKTTLEPILSRLCDPKSEPPTVWEPTAQDRKFRFTKGEIAERVRLSQKRVLYALAAREVGVPHPSQILELKVCDPAMGSGAFLVETCRQLADELIRSWYAHDLVPTDIPADEDEVLYARRLIAQRCLYGVDKNVMAVDLAKLSLWLVTLAKDHAFTFLDHCLRHGDALVGLSREQIIGFHWEVSSQKKLGENDLQKRLDRATEARAKIMNAREDVPYRDQQQRMAHADEALNVIRLLGDACVSCFFDPGGTSGAETSSRSKPSKKTRDAAVDRMYQFATDYVESLKGRRSDGQSTGVDFTARQALRLAQARLRGHGEYPVPALHWEIEFPEVFSRENGGFDAFVGNPPFAGKNTLINANRVGFLSWLLEVHQDSHGNSDLVAHFFRAAFCRLRIGGAIGFIATNTIGQGDTRHTGLRFIRNNNGDIYFVTRRKSWPGAAAVIVSVVHVLKGEYQSARMIDGAPVDQITAFLFERGSDENPPTLHANKGLAFQGSILLGMGFTFDDTSSKPASNSLSEMEALIRKDKNNQDLIFPYIGGEEVNNSPTYRNHRFTIDFSDRSYAEASQWPDLLAVVRDKVKPERDHQKRKALRERWWQYAEKRPGLYNAISELDRVLVINCGATPHMAFAILDSRMVFANSLVIVALDSWPVFACCQSRVHETWTRFFASSMKDDLRYTHSDCFETYAFPDGCANSAQLADRGDEYHAFRSSLMVSNEEGMTKTYNRFHSPEEKCGEVLELRRLHGRMDDAVLRAYGWDDLADEAAQPDFCQFLLDFETDETEDEPSTRKRAKKKPYRYRWPDSFRDEVLARLLELNQQRYQEEQAALRKDKTKGGK